MSAPATPAPAPRPPDDAPESQGAPEAPGAPDDRRDGTARPAPGGRAVTALLVLLVVVAAAAVGVGAADGGGAGVALPVAVAAAALVGMLAATRLLLVVALLLAVRTSLDVLGGGGPGLARALDPAGLASVLLVVATAAAVVVRRSQGEPLPRSALRTAFLLFTGAAALSLLGAAAPAAGLVELLRLASVVAMLVVLQVLVTSRRRLVVVLAAVGAAAAAPLGVGLAQVAGLAPLGAPVAGAAGVLGRLTGPFDHPTTYARVLLVLVLVGLALLPALPRRGRVPLGLALLVGTGLLLATLTRGAVLAGLVGVLVLAVVQRRPTVLLGTLGAGAAGWLLLPGVADRFGQVTSGAVADPTGNSLAWRLDYWSQVLPLVADRPLTGVGLDGVRALTDAGKLPHNDYLRALVETGVLGLLAHAAVMAALVGTGLAALRATAPGRDLRALGSRRPGGPRTSLEHATAAAATAVGAAVVVASAAANLVTGVVVLWYVVALAACAGALARGLVPPVPGAPAVRTAPTVPAP